MTDLRKSFTTPARTSTGSQLPGCTLDARAARCGGRRRRDRDPTARPGRSPDRSSGRSEPRRARCDVRTALADADGSARTSCAGERSLPALPVRAQRPQSLPISLGLGYPRRSRFIVLESGGNAVQCGFSDRVEPIRTGICRVFRQTEIVGERSSHRQKDAAASVVSSVVASLCERDA